LVLENIALRQMQACREAAERPGNRDAGSSYATENGFALLNGERVACLCRKVAGERVANVVTPQRPQPCQPTERLQNLPAGGAIQHGPAGVIENVFAPAMSFS